MSKFIVDDVTYAQHVANLVSGTAKNDLTASAKSIAHRIPVHLCASVDAMAHHSGKSRNAMINLLINVGLSEVRAELSEEVAQSLVVAESKALAALLDQRLVADIDSITE
jgi:hypothetical protein